MTDTNRTTDEQVWIGTDHLKLLEAVAEAASDLRMGTRDAEFADLNGGTEKLQRILFDKVTSWEFFAAMNLSEDV